MRKRIIICIVTLGIFCGLMSGCKSNLNSPVVSDKRTVIDMTGNSVELPDTVDKVFCDWASGITLIMTLGATNKLVAIPNAFDSDTFAWARIICPDIDNILRKDEAFTNVEEVLNLNPNLVITNDKDKIEMYTNIGLTTIYVTFNNNDSFKESMLIVGEALGLDELEVAKKYNAYFDNNVTMVKERLSGVSEKPKVYYMDSRFNDVYHTVGANEIQEDWISIAGGILVTANDFEGRNLEINAEKLLLMDPEYILIGAQNQASVYDALMQNNVLAGLTSINENKVYRIPQGIFPWCRTGSEAAIQVIWAAKLFHPEQFVDIEIKDVAKQFYAEFYGNEVTDDVLNDIIAGKLCPTGN